MAAVKVEVGRLQEFLTVKDEEIDRLRQSADGTNFRNSEIADDRDRIVRVDWRDFFPVESASLYLFSVFFLQAFEVADLSRQLREITEKHKVELSSLQNSLQERIAAEEILRKDLALVRKFPSALYEISPYRLIG